MLILNQIFKLVKLINSETGKYQLSIGFALGMIMGLTPFFGLHQILFIFLACIFRINIAAMVLTWAVFGIVAYPLDNMFHDLGIYILTGIPMLKGFFTRLYNMPIIPWSRFNNTVMIGSFVTGLIVFIPSVFLYGFFIDKYRVTVREKMRNSKIYKGLKATKIYGLYKKYERIKETF